VPTEPHAEGNRTVADIHRQWRAAAIIVATLGKETERDQNMSLANSAFVRERSLKSWAH